jgi:hypothetical protein
MSICVYMAVCLRTRSSGISSRVCGQSASELSKERDVFRTFERA